MRRLSNRLALMMVLATAPTTIVSRPARADDWAIERTPGRRPAGRTPSSRPVRDPRAADRRDRLRVDRPPADPSPPEAEAPTGVDSGADAERWLALVLARPVDGPMLARLVRGYRDRDGSTDALVARLAELAADDDPARAFAATCVLGHVHARERAFDAALAAYRSALVLRADAPIPLVGTGRIERERGQLGEAMAHLAAAYEHAGGGVSPEHDTIDAEARRALALEIGRLALVQRDFEATERWFERATRGRSRYERGELARAYADAGEHARAVQVLAGLAAAARGDAREHAPALRDLGLAQLDAGSFDEAIASLVRARSVAAGDSGLVLEIDDALVSAHRRAGRLALYVDSLEARAPRDGAGLARLAALEEELGRDEAALGTYARAITRAPRELEPRAARIRLLMRQGQVEAAVAEEAELVALAPHESRFVVAAIERLVSLGRRERAMALFDAAARRAGDDRAAHASLAELAERLAEADRLASELETLVRLEPDEPSHRIALASDRIARGDRGAALALFEQALADARTSRALVSVVRALADRGFVHEAEVALDRASERDPGDLELARARADVLDPDRRTPGEPPDRHRDALALATLRRVLVHPDADATTRREARRRIVALEARAGTLAVRMSEWGRALAAGTASDGGDGGASAIEAGTMLIEARERERPLDAAGIERIARRLIALAPRDPSAWLTVERACTIRQDHACAIEALERLVVLDATRADTYFDRLIQHAEASYRDDDAILFATRSVERSPNDPRAEARLGQLFRRRGDSAAAIAAFRRALARDDRRHETWLELAEVLVAEHDYDGAARAFARVLALGPDDDVLTRAAELAARSLGSAGRDDAVVELLLPQVAARPRLVGLHRVLFTTLERRVTVLEARADADSRAELVTIGARGLAVLLAALASPDVDRAARSARLLGRLRVESSLDALLAAVARHPAATVRHEALVAAASLATRTRRDAFRPLIDAPERRTRVRAAFVYAALGTDEPERVSLREHEDTWVRAVFVLASVSAGARVDAAWLESHFARERDPALRAAIVLAMAAHGREFLEPLSRFARERGLVGDAARIALARIDESSADAALAAVLDEGDGNVRRAAWLAHLGRDAPFPALVSLGGLDLDAALRAVTTSMLVAGAPPTPRLLDAIAERLAFQPDAERAVARLGELEAMSATLPECPPIGTALSLAMRDARPAVRAEAVRLLARFDRAGADRLLPDALGDAAAAVIVAALEGASAAGLRAEGGRLALLLGSHPELEVRRLAAEKAASARPADVLEALENAAIHDAVAFVRQSAVRSLRGLDPENTTLAEVARSDPEPRVRAAAANRIEGMSDAESRHDVDVGAETRVPMRSRAGPAGDRTFDG